MFDELILGWSVFSISNFYLIYIEQLLFEMMINEWFLIFE